MTVIKLTAFGYDDAEHPFYLSTSGISFYPRLDGLTEICAGGIKTTVKETPEEILRLIEEAEQPSHTVAGGYSPSYLPNNSTMISPADLKKINSASRVQQLIDEAHAVEQLMREKDPTYGR